MSEIKQLPSFNGWRAVAILMVMGCHLEFTRGFPEPCGNLIARIIDGNLGVRFFFTVSGFLITWLMVREENQSGTVSLKNFYLRRALRILPVYATCLAVLAAFQWAGLYQQRTFIWIQLLTFTRDFYNSRMECLTTGHIWSLSVEEQFYLVWPAVFILLGNSLRRRTVLLAGVAVFSIAWKVLALLGWYNRHLAFLFVPLAPGHYLDCLAYGCLGAIWFAAREAELRDFFARFGQWITLAAVFLIVFPEFAGLGDAVQSTGFALILLQSVLFPDRGLYKWLNHPLMARIGILSYSLYIWHQPIFVNWPFPRLWMLVYPTTFAAAWLSYNYLERPFFSLRSRFRPNPPRPA